MATETDNYRILSLDGGGTWALIQAVALADMYGLQTKGKEILNRFDLAIANSGGSIVLAGLVMDMTPLDIFRLFDDPDIRKGIFAKKYFNFPGFRKYRTNPSRCNPKSKATGLAKAFESYRDIRCRLADLGKLGITADIVVCTFDYDRERAKFFRSNTRSLAASGSGIPGSKFATTLLEAIHAASTAPVRYFDNPAPIRAPERKAFDGVARCWDGAVGGFNNPVMAGVVETVANKSNGAKAIRALSIGTGNTFLPLGVQGMQNSGLFKIPQRPCLLSDIKLLARAIISDPPDAASFTAHVMLGGALPSGTECVADGPVVRINPLIQPRKAASDAYAWELPDGFTAREFMRLAELELDAVAQDDVDLIKKLAARWLQDGAVNQAVRADGLTLKCEIGCDKYSQAKAQWQNYDPGATTPTDNRRKILELL
jgi:hypothetical protein